MSDAESTWSRDATLASALRRRLRRGSSAASTDAVHAVLASARDRDLVADARDASAEQRDRERDLADMLDVEGTYGDGLPLRREAALERLHAQDDREAARRDREALARMLGYDV